MKKIAVFASILPAGFAQSRLNAAECSTADLRGVYSLVALATFDGGPFATRGQTTNEGNGSASLFLSPMARPHLLRYNNRSYSRV